MHMGKGLLGKQATSQGEETAQLRSHRHKLKTELSAVVRGTLLTWSLEKALTVRLTQHAHTSYSTLEQTQRRWGIPEPPMTEVKGPGKLALCPQNHGGTGQGPNSFLSRNPEVILWLRQMPRTPLTVAAVRHHYSVTKKREGAIKRFHAPLYKDRATLLRAHLYANLQ